jgi:hypothetical protein
MNLILFSPDDYPGISAAGLLVCHHYAMTEGRPYNPACYCGTCEARGKEMAEELVAVAGSMETATERMFYYLNTLSMCPIRCGDWEGAERFVAVWLEAYKATLMEAAPVAGNA